LKSKGGGVTGANNPPADVWRNVTQRGHRAAILQRSLTTQWGWWWWWWWWW